MDLYDLCLVAVNRKGDEINDNWFYKKNNWLHLFTMYIFMYVGDCMYTFYDNYNNAKIKLIWIKINIIFRKAMNQITTK